MIDLNSATNQRVIKLLGEGFLRPDRQNLLFFMKLLTLVAILVVVSFSAGFLIAYEWAYKSAKVEIEQINRTAAVYRSGP